MPEPITKIVPSKLELHFESFVYKVFLPLVPKNVTPNGITTVGSLFGLLGILSASLSAINRFYLIGTIIGLIGHLICDDLDGQLAKKVNMRTTAGAYYDLLTDILHLTFLLIALSLTTVIKWQIGILLVPVYPLLMFTSMNEINYLKIFRFPTVGPLEAHLCFIALCVVAMLFKEPVIYGLQAADIVAILGGLPMYFEMFRLQIKLFLDLKASDKQ